MASTIALVRTAIVNAIKSVATTSIASGGLGLDASTGVKDFLFEYVPLDDWESYLLNDIGSAPALRAVGVMVLSEYPQGFFFDFNGNSRRRYISTVEVYNSLGFDGTAVNNVVAMQENIVKAIRDLESNLGGVVDFTDSPILDSPSIISAPDDWEETEMLVGRITIESEIGAATW